MLKRGYVLLMAGGAMIAISFSMFAYYGMQFINSLEQDEKLVLEPGESVKLSRSINASQGAYVVAFPDFEGRPRVEVRDPSDQIVIERNIEPPIIIEPFQAAQPGNYTLTLSNPTDRTLGATVVLGDQDDVLSRGFDVSTATTALALILIFGTGIAVAGAGAVITILDRRRIDRMKRFGDTSDLV